MPSWASYTIPMIPGLETPIEGASAGLTAMKGALEAFAGLADALAKIARLYPDLVNQAVKTPLYALRAVAVQITDLLTHDPAFYVDPGPLYTDGAPDGMTGFLKRWSDSFYDEGDKNRPVFAADAHVAALLIVAGANDLPSFTAIMETLSIIIATPGRCSVRKKAPTERHLEALEKTLSTPPDWKKAPLAENIPPMGDLAELLNKAVGLMDAADDLATLIQDVANLAQKRAEALDKLVDQLQTALETIRGLLKSTGLYVVKLDSTSGIAGLLEAATSAETPPPWNGEAYVAGFCALSATVDFAPIQTLLVDGINLNA